MSDSSRDPKETRDAYTGETDGNGRLKSDANLKQRLNGVLAEYELLIAEGDSGQQATICPCDADEQEIVTEWITADASALRNLGDMR